ncbi:hypothetical protein GGR53DRAFT_224054 [Hypoxylon sp. FL1150]|nr:hypothetical protein GGR53DRAFT_224054 [Hypoxylon sp. FL1150]
MCKLLSTSPVALFLSKLPCDRVSCSICSDVTHLSCGESVVDSATARAETPGSCATDAVAEEVELGRDIGSRVAGNDGAGTDSGACAGIVPVPTPSSMADRIGGNAGDAVRVGIGSPINGRLFSACNDATVGDAVMDAVVGELKCPEKTRDYRVWCRKIVGRY